MHRAMKWTGAAAIVVVALGGWAFWMARQPPLWYAPPVIDDLASDRASQVELGCVATFQKIRPSDETWTLRLTEAGINLWLAARLSDWVTNHLDETWPEAMGVPQVSISPNTIRIGLMSAGGWTPSLTVSPTVESGDVHLTCIGGSIGQLSLPGLAPILVERLGQYVPPSIGGGALLRDAGRPAILTLIDDRRVEIIGIDAQDGQVIITARTLPPHTPAHGDGE